MPTSYPLSVQQCQREAEWEVGGGALSGPAEMRELVDRAGHALVSMAPWRWLNGRQARLRTRASIDLTGATWTEATKTLTKTAAFASYTWLEADTLDLTDGTGATAAFYEVTSRTSDDAIVLATSIGSAADGQTDIEATLPNDQVALPSDFDIQRVTAYATVGNVWNGLALGSGQDVLDLRWSGTRWVANFFGLLNHVRALADGRTIPRLDLAPHSSQGTEELVIFYRAGWATPEDDGAPLPLPMSGWLNSLFLEILKAHAHVQEDDESLGSLGQRLAAIQAGPVFRMALERDQVMQPLLGSSDAGGGWMQGRGIDWKNGGWWDRGSRLLPSV